MDFYGAITDVPGIKVGHATNEEALTGCTVILCPKGTVGGVDQRGGAPGTRETDLLRPLHLVEHVNAILLAGGSAFGLDAASGVMKYLEEQEIGYNTGAARVPIVPTAILFDLDLGDPTLRPDAHMGYQACKNGNPDPSLEGNVGAGTGCTVGKLFGVNQSMKSGIGTASITLKNNIIIGAIVAVNAFGDIYNPSTGEIVAGARIPGTKNQFANTLAVMRSQLDHSSLDFPSRSNTVIGVVATNALLNKNETNKVAQMAHNGLAQTIRPAHTMFDGDTIFALATGEKTANVNIVGAFAAEMMASAVLRAVFKATKAAGLPTASNFHGHI